MKENQKYSDGFLIIPKEILTASKYKGKPLGFAEKCVYSYLLSWSLSCDKVFPSTSRMCQDLGIGSRTSISKYLSKLEELNLIVIHNTKGKSSTYEVLNFEGLNVEVPKKDYLNKGKQTVKQKDQPIKIEPVIDNNPFDYDYDSLFGEDLCPY